MLWAAFASSEPGTSQSPVTLDLDQHLSPLNIAMNCHSNSTLLRVTLKQSKTELFRNRIHIFLGHSETDLYSVSAVPSYLVKRGNEQGPFFKFANGRPLIRERLVSQLCKVLAKIGIKTDQFAGHSFRIGAAIKAAALRIKDSVIKMLG